MLLGDDFFLWTPSFPLRGIEPSFPSIHTKFHHPFLRCAARPTLCLPLNSSTLSCCCLKFLFIFSWVLLFRLDWEYFENRGPTPSSSLGPQLPYKEFGINTSKGWWFWWEQRAWRGEGGTLYLFRTVHHCFWTSGLAQPTPGGLLALPRLQPSSLFSSSSPSS